MNNQPLVLITGANKGIGFETARQLAAKGCHVFIGSRDPSRGEEAAAKIGTGAERVVLDVTASSSIRQAADTIQQRSGRLDVLINNAGIYADEGINVLDVDRDIVRGTFETNSFGALEVIQAFMPLLRKANEARIINVSSGYGALEDLSPNVPSYCLSKLALNGITLLVSRALAADGIPVNSVCPGWVRTDMGGADATRSVEEGADTIVWLATEAPRTLSGRFLRDRREIDW